jgi:GntR family transcriptional repressor for pyruvate dehydrogenase complex
MPSEAGDLFKTLERERSLVIRVEAQIEALILEGRLRVGDQLPTEARLARRFGVSRTVIREATSRLMARSLLEAQPGGLVVCSPSTESVGRSLSLMLRMGQEPLEHERVLEVRRLIEVEIAGLAAERRTEVNLRKMAEILSTAEKLRDDPENFPQLDVAFHRELAIATQNELYVILLDAVSDTLMSYRRVGFRVPGMPDRSLRHHRAIFEQVSAGSVAGAREAMRAHLVEARRTVLEAAALAPAGGTASSTQGHAVHEKGDPE